MYVCVCDVHLIWTAHMYCGVGLGTHFLPNLGAYRADVDHMAINHTLLDLILKLTSSEPINESSTGRFRIVQPFPL